MSTSTRTDDTTPMRDSLAIDARALEPWMRAHVADFVGPIELRQFKGGQSNPTYLVATPRARYVLRRKPPGQLLASAHAVDREYRVMTALALTAVPVARTFAYCADAGVIGTEFYVMEFVSGRVFWDTSFDSVAREQRAAYFDALNATIASLHTVDFRAVGLSDFGRAEQYVARQVARWSRQYLQDDAAGRVPAMDRLIEWLPANLPPEQPAALVHGDYRADNVVFHETEPRVLAVLDWELATIGDPLADFTYHLTMYHMPSAAIPGLLGKDLKALGIPSEQAYLEAYCRRTGRHGLPHLDFYLAFCFFRLAAIFHGIRGRVVRGTAVSPRARDYASHVETLADLAWRHVER